MGACDKAGLRGGIDPVLKAAFDKLQETPAAWAARHEAEDRSLGDGSRRTVFTESAGCMEGCMFDVYSSEEMHIVRAASAEHGLSCGVPTDRVRDHAEGRDP